MDEVCINSMNILKEWEEVILLTVAGGIFQASKCLYI